MRYKELKNIMDKKSNKKKVFDEGNPRIILVDARTMGSRPVELECISSIFCWR